MVPWTRLGDCVVSICRKLDSVPNHLQYTALLLGTLGTVHHPSKVSSNSNYEIMHACSSLHYGFDLIATS